MKDVRGVDINLGDNVLFTESQDGNFQEGTVVGFTQNSVKILMTNSWRKDPVKKLPKFVVIK